MMIFFQVLIGGCGALAVLALLFFVARFWFRLSKGEVWGFFVMCASYVLIAAVVAQLLYWALSA